MWDPRHLIYGLLRESFTFLYVDDVRTSQEVYRPSWPVTGIALLIYIYIYIYDVRTSQNKEKNKLRGP
jgi:hypothetical protein